jgi:5'-nucleotidase
VLEEQFQPTGASRPFLALGVSRGLRYGFDASAPRGSRIHSLTLNGAPVSPTATYRIVTNSFLASGGDNFTTLGGGTDRRDTGRDDLSVLVAHFRANSPITPDTTDRAVPGPHRSRRPSRRRSRRHAPGDAAGHAPGDAARSRPR